ncbi:hypothetical protein Tco_0133171 [Tanacetum coccineum]
MKSRKRRFKQNTSQDDPSDTEKENDELRLCLTIAPDEDKEVDYEILDKKYPIIDWKTEYLGTKPQFDESKRLEEINLNVVTRSNGQKRYFSTLMRVLSVFDREDLDAVYKLVMNIYQDKIPEGFDKVLWGDLIVMFNPDEQDEFWNSQHEWNIVSWKLHSSSGVHTLMTDEGLVIHMLIEKKYPLKKEILVQMLKLKLESEEESTMALELIRFIKKSWLVQDQTVLGKDYSNLLIADSLLKTIWFINAPCYDNEALASPNTNDEELSIPEQTATGKGTSNPLMAGSLPKTTKPTYCSLFFLVPVLRFRINTLYYHKHPEEPQSPPLPDFVPKPVYPEYMAQEDEVFPAKEQPLPATASPTAQSPYYVPESDPEEDSEEDDDEDREEDPADYPADGGDDGDDEDEPSDDDEDEEVDIKVDDEEDEEHPAPTDSTAVALPAINQAPSAEETEPFETDESTATLPPHLAYRITARISIPAPVPTPVWFDAEVAILLAISTPPSSPLSPWSSPLPQIPSPPLPPILSPLPVSPALPEIPSPPLPVSSPVHVLSPPPLASPIRPLGYRAAMIRLRAEAASTSHSLPLPPPIILSHTRPDAPSSGIPPLHLLYTDCKADRLEVTLPPRKRLGIALGPRYEVGESSSAAAARPARGLRPDYGFVATMDREIRHDLERDVGYGITDSWDEIVEAIQGTPVVTNVVEFSQRMTEFETRVRHDTNEIYTRLDDEQSEQQLMADQLNVLYRDRCAHARGSTAGSDYRATGSRPQEAGGDYRDAAGKSQEAKAVHRGTEAAKEASDSDDRVRETLGTRQRSCTARCTRGGW